MAKALLQRGWLLVQVGGAAVGGKLTRLGSPSPFPVLASASPVRPPPSLPVPEGAFQSAEPPEPDQDSFAAA